MAHLAPLANAVVMSAAATLYAADQGTLADGAVAPSKRSTTGQATALLRASRRMLTESNVISGEGSGASRGCNSEACGEEFAREIGEGSGASRGATPKPVARSLPVILDEIVAHKRRQHEARENIALDRLWQESGAAATRASVRAATRAFVR